MAMATNDIAATIKALRARGVEFLDVPDAYYDTVMDRVGTIEEDPELMKKKQENRPRNHWSRLSIILKRLLKTCWKVLYSQSPCSTSKEK